MYSVADESVSVMETRPSGLKNCNINEIINEEKLIKLGWVPVPSINGSGCTSWTEITEQMKKNGLAASVCGDWTSEPVVVRNQQLFVINQEFVKDIASMKTGLRLILNVRKKWKLNGSNRIYGPISSLDSEYSKTSNAWSFNADGLCRYSFPNTLELTKIDGICSIGKWFTAGHVETGGDDSITHVPVGKKLMVIAKRGKASRRVESLLTSAKAVVELLSKPPSALWKQTLKFYISDPYSLMIQPALCAHAVITVNEGPALVVGFEGKMDADIYRRSQVLQYYSTGLGRERRTALLQNYSDPQALLKLRAIKRSKTSLHEHLECLQFDQKPKQKPYDKGIKLSKRKKRMLFLGRVKNKYEKKAKKRKGKQLS